MAALIKAEWKQKHLGGDRAGERRGGYCIRKRIEGKGTAGFGGRQLANGSPS